jgi:glycosyltransferase involved in cell wall biosynthesis
MTGNTNKVLIISYFFDSATSAGGRRYRGLARFLPEFGWETVVLTASPPGLPDPEYKLVSTTRHESFTRARKMFHLDTGNTLMSQIAELKSKLGIGSKWSFLEYFMTAFGEVFAYPDLQKGWRKLAVESATDLLQHGDIKAIISAFPPATAHIIGSELKKKYKIPWIADYDDLWSQNYCYPYSPLRRRLDRRLEVKTIADADTLLTVSGPLAAELAELHQGKTTYGIASGFDPAILNRTPGKLTEKFTITYTGNIYPRRQSPELLFAALKELIVGGDINPHDVEVRFSGARLLWLDKLAKRYDLADIVKQYGMVPQRVAQEKQRESQLLLLLKWQDPEHPGVYTAKIFEYLAAGRPIMAVGGFDDVVSELLDETRAGSWTKTKDDVKSFLIASYREYKQTGAVKYSGKYDKIEKYSHGELVRQYASILDSVI